MTTQFSLYQTSLLQNNYIQNTAIVPLTQLPVEPATLIVWLSNAIELPFITSINDTLFRPHDLTQLSNSRLITTSIITHHRAEISSSRLTTRSSLSSSTTPRTAKRTKDRMRDYRGVAREIYPFTFPGRSSRLGESACVTLHHPARHANYGEISTVQKCDAFFAVSIAHRAIFCDSGS